MNRYQYQAPLRTLVKDFVLACLYWTGLLWLLAFARLRHRAVVLTYHRVLPSERMDLSFSAPSIVVTPDTFDWQMRFIKRFLRPVDTDTFLALLASGSPPPDRTCLVTFDDGWYDNLDFALPILLRHGVPAVLFVATDYVGSQDCFWQERLARLLFDLRESKLGAAMLDELGASRAKELPPADAKSDIRDLVEKLKRRPREDINGIVRRLINSVGPSASVSAEDRFLSWDEVRRMAHSGIVAIGSHAMSHTPLTTLPASIVEVELRHSAKVIGDAVGKIPALLAYPNGNADQEIGEQAKAGGYAAAFTTARGLVSARCNPHLLPRINIHEAATRSRAAFLGRIAGLL
jgi:peptidoglycan/xylan/chitin deacetylase (PgdA/CDA1 family)